MKKLIILLVFLIIILISIGAYFLTQTSHDTETLTLSLSTELGNETTIIKKNNNLKEAEIDTEIDINFDLSSILAETATASAYKSQEMFFGDEEIKFDYEPSKEEKEYLRKMNEFLKGYEIKKVKASVKTAKGKEGFEYILIGTDDTKNTLVLISEDGSRYTLKLNQAKEQYILGTNSVYSI